MTAGTAAKKAAPKADRKPGEGFPSDEGYIESTSEKYMALVSSPELNDPKAMREQIAQRVLSADSVDSVLGLGEASAISSDDYVGIPFTIRGVDWARSAPQYQDDSAGVFVLISAVNEGGESVTITSGGSNVLAQLYRLHELTGGDWTQVPPMMFRSVDTSSGYTTLWLQKAA